MTINFKNSKCFCNHNTSIDNSKIEIRKIDKLINKNENSLVSLNKIKNENNETSLKLLDLKRQNHVNYLLLQLYKLYANCICIIYMNRGSSVTGLIGELLSNNDNESGLLRVLNSKGDLISLVSTEDICAIEFKNSSYNNDIKYLDLKFITNNSDKIISIRDNTGIESTLSIITGSIRFDNKKVLKNEYGFIVTIDEGGIDPIFINTNHIQQII